MNSPFKLLDDQPVGLAGDRLHFRRYAQALETLLFHSSAPAAPLSVGIYGASGSGKSSLLRMLGERLRQPEFAAGWQGLEITPDRLAPEQEEQIRNGLVGKRLVVLADGLESLAPEQAAAFLRHLQGLIASSNSLLIIALDRARLASAPHAVSCPAPEAGTEMRVQVPFEISQHQSSHLVDMLGPQMPELQMYLLRVAEICQSNPRAFKLLWNQAVLGLSVVHAELERVQGFRHEPSLILMLKWLLLKNRGGLRQNPYRYLSFESRVLESTDLPGLREEFMQELGFAAIAPRCGWQTDSDCRLAVFLWHDLARHRFGSPRILSLYAGNSGEDLSRSRLFLEENRFAGQLRIERQDFAWAALSAGYFAEMHFIECDFSFADLQNADLANAVFERCRLHGTRFDGAMLSGTRWLACDSLDSLDTSPDSYETIADRALQTWRESPPPAWNPEPLYKVYKSILHRLGGIGGEILRERLLQKGVQAREIVLQAGIRLGL